MGRLAAFRQGRSRGLFLSRGLRHLSRLPSRPFSQRSSILASVRRRCWPLMSLSPFWPAFRWECSRGSFDSSLSPVSRLPGSPFGSGIALVWAGVGVTGAMLGTVAAQAATFALGVRLLRMTRDAWRATRRTVGHLRGTFAATFLALSSFWLVAELDIALARHFLAEENAGYYSSAGLVARALLFLPAAVSIVAFPRFVDARASGTEAARWLKISFAAVGGLVLLALPILVLLRRFVVTIAFGDEYLPATSLLPVLAVAMSLLALVNLLVYFHVAMGSRAHYFVLAAAGFETVLIALFHGSAQEIAVIVAAVSGALVLLELHAAAALCRYSPTTCRLADESLPLSGDPTVELSLVLPCHNAAVGLNRMLKRLVAELDDVGSYEVIVVSDGSTDETVKVAGEFPGDGVRVLQYAERTGKD